MQRLLPNEDAEAGLRALCRLSSKLWSEISYARRGMFFKEKKVDLRQTYKEFNEN